MNKYKLLVSKNLKSAIEFIDNCDKYFDAVGVPDNIDDIKNQCDTFKPDAFVIFLETAQSRYIRIAESLSKDSAYNSLHIIVVGNNTVCDEIMNEYPELSELYIRLPIITDNIILRIMWFLNVLKRCEEMRLSSASESIAKSGKRHILAVDDDRSVLNLLKEALGESYDMTTMVNGALVEKIIEANDIDIILLDHEMPVENGAEIFEKLKKHPKGKNIPVCFLTGVSERSEIDKIMSLEPQGYLQKPINIELLMKTIENIIL